MTSEESIQKRELYCTLCGESLKIIELERHYNHSGHVGTYSPFAWLEQFVQIRTVEGYISKKELQEKIKKLIPDLEIWNTKIITQRNFQNEYRNWIFREEMQNCYAVTKSAILNKLLSQISQGGVKE